MLMVQSSMLGVGPTLLLAPGERAHAASIAAAEQESLRRVQEKKATRRRDVDADHALSR